ncbi:Protein mahjong [Eumeta japonica]|uniref:Protein mahjong n=1 Tax=Eumeta variegata TaxID=151549 RepID=A0A4C1VKD4_EUMVA|nr:Protein mahjong [Eumeta japonica]
MSFLKTNARRDARRVCGVDGESRFSPSTHMRLDSQHDLRPAPHLYSAGNKIMESWGPRTRPCGNRGYCEITKPHLRRYRHVENPTCFEGLIGSHALPPPAAVSCAPKRQTFVAHAWLLNVLVLLSLMMVKSPITDADRIRGLACRALAGLARCPTVRQIISKLPLFTTSQIQNLMRDPILQEKRQEHVMFQKYALELLERVSGKSKHMGTEFETSLANIHRANVVAQTRISYNERQLLQLIHEELVARGLSQSASTLLREAALPPPAAPSPPDPLPPHPPPVYTPSTPIRPRLASRTGGGPLRDSFDTSAAPLDDSLTLAPAQVTPNPHVIKLRKVQPLVSLSSGSLSSLGSPGEPRRSLQKQLSVAGGQGGQTKPPRRVTLHAIVTEYLYNQHSLCKNPMATCPQFNLFEPHKCPEPRPSHRHNEPPNVAERWARRELDAQAGRARPSRRADTRLAHSHFCAARTLRLQDDDAFFTHTMFHNLHPRYLNNLFPQPTQQQLLAATSAGDIRVFNLFSGAEENSYQVHESYIHHIQASRDGLLLLASATTTWRPLSALWNLKEFHQLFQLDNEEYVEFSKMTDDRIIGTRGETATIFDTRTGRELLTLTPTISNQYAKNRATFNPTDELVLSDGVLWDVNTGKEIHKFDKLNQTHSGVFHPNGLEVISNTEVWDLRTFHLLRTVPTLDKSEVVFNPTCTALYAVCSDQDSDDKCQFDTSFKTLDPYDYSSIATIDVKRNIYALSVSRAGTQIALVENMGDFERMQESCVKIYDVGRRRDQDDDAEEDEEEDIAGGSDNDDGSDSGSDNEELPSSILRDAVLGLADEDASSGESSRDQDERPPRRRRSRRTRRRRVRTPLSVHAELRVVRKSVSAYYIRLVKSALHAAEGRSSASGSDSDSDSDSDNDLDLGDIIEFEFD